MKLQKENIQEINQVIIDGVNSIYDLIDKIFNLNNQIDNTFKNDLVPLVVNASIDLIEDSKFDGKTLENVLNKIYDRLDAQYNLNAILDFSFKSVLIPLISNFIISQINKIIPGPGNNN